MQFQLLKINSEPRRTPEQAPALPNTYLSTHIIMAEFDPGVQLLLVLVVEGRVAHQENIQDYPTRPDVCWFTVNVLFYNFGGEITGRSCKTWQISNCYGEVVRRTCKTWLIWNFAEFEFSDLEYFSTVMIY